MVLSGNDDLCRQILPYKVQEMTNGDMVQIRRDDLCRQVCYSSRYVFVVVEMTYRDRYCEL